MLTGYQMIICYSRAIFNYGDLVLELVGQGPPFVIRNIESPQTIMERIQNARRLGEE